MKLGDLVRYNSTRFRVIHNHPGVVIKLYYEDPVNCPGAIAGKEMADVLFSYGVVSDDTYEFEVANEDR